MDSVIHAGNCDGKKMPGHNDQLQTKELFNSFFHLLLCENGYQREWLSESILLYAGMSWVWD